MPDIGSYVIYGANGICIVRDKRKEKLCGTKNYGQPMKLPLSVLKI